MLLEIQWLQLNQQSQCWHGLQGQILAEAQRHREQREKIYRAQALKRCPWIYTRCGRAFRDNKLAACHAYSKRSIMTLHGGTLI